MKTAFFLAMQKGREYFAMPVEHQILQIGIYLQIDVYKKTRYCFNRKGQ